MNEYVFGLASRRILRPETPANQRFLFRGAWRGEEDRGQLVELLVGDKFLYAALSWLATESGEVLKSVPTENDASELVQSFGLECTREAALGIVMFRSYRTGCSEEFQFDAFWTRSLARGLAAKNAAEFLKAASPVRAFLSSFLADLGEAAFVLHDPAGYDQLLRDLDESQSTSGAEYTHFGIRREALTWVLLRDCGLPREVFGYARAMSHSTLTLDHSEASMEDKEHFSISIGKLLGDLIVADGASRAAMWPGLVALRKHLDLDREELNALCDHTVSDWWCWGDLLNIPTMTLPGFSELSDWNERGIQPVRYNRTATQPLVPDASETGFDVLLAEDNPVVRERTRRLLMSAGHLVRTAADGHEALMLVRQDPPQIVLADWHMPGLNGLELCRVLRRTELGKRTFFILFTGEDEEDRIVSAYQAGINDFSAKRSSPAILLARINAAHNFLKQWKRMDEDRRIIRNHCEHGRKQTARMREDSLTDTLTGLPNRRFAMARLADEWERAARTGHPLAAIMLDIDHFKVVNDKYGHDVGDYVLQETAQILHEVTRRNESACRIGGEEFLVICSDADLAAAASCAERIRKAIEGNRMRFAGFDGGVTVSLGVAQCSADLGDPNALLKASDEAGYRAKETGRNRVVLWPSLEEARFIGERLAG